MLTSRTTNPYYLKDLTNPPLLKGLTHPLHLKDMTNPHHLKDMTHTPLLKNMTHRPHLRDTTTLIKVLPETKFQNLLKRLARVLTPLHKIRGSVIPPNLLLIRRHLINKRVKKINHILVMLELE